MKYHSTKCPQCEVPDSLQFGDIDMEGGAVVQTWVCNECGTEGHDWYPPGQRVQTTDRDGEPLKGGAISFDPSEIVS